MTMDKAKIQTNRNRGYQLVYQTGTITKPEIAGRLGVSLKFNYGYQQSGSSF